MSPALQLDPSYLCRAAPLGLLGLTFKRDPKLLGLALQLDPLKNLGQTCLILLLILKILLFIL
jgi:hypothetical protein